MFFTPVSEAAAEITDIVWSANLGVGGMEGTQEVVGTWGAGSAGDMDGTSSVPPFAGCCTGGGQPVAVFKMRFGVGSPWVGCHLCQAVGDTKMGCGAWGHGQGLLKCWAAPQPH